jgi:hypothetical protein
MTNILDSVEPDCWVRPRWKGGLVATKKQNKFIFDYPHYSRETVESMLEAHRKQVLLEAAERCKERSDRYERNAMNDTQKESHWVVRAIGAEDCADELRRMAEGGN